MTIPHDPAECARLIAELREDAARMPDMPDCLCRECSVRRRFLGLADQLEVACSEIDRLMERK